MGLRTAWAAEDFEYADRRRLPSHQGGVQRLEMTAVASLVLREEPRDVGGGNRSVLKATLGKHGHLDSQHCAHAARDDLALERVQAFVRALGQLGEGNRFRHGNHRRSRVRAKAVESELPRAGVAADAAAAITARVGERVLDRVDSPTFLIEHSIVDDAANSKLAIRLDGVVLEILVAAIAVDQQTPLRIALTNAGEEGEIRGRTFDVERLAVLDHGHRSQGIQRARRDVDDLAEHFEAGLTKEVTRLTRIVAFAVNRKGKGLETCRRLACVEQQLVQT